MDRSKWFILLKSFLSPAQVTLLENVNSEWLRGAFGMREGIFPRSFVQILVPLPEPTDEPEPVLPPAQTPPKTSTVAVTTATTMASTPPTTASYPGFTTVPMPGKGLVIYSFEPANDDELPLAEGKTVELIEAVGPDWFKGRLRDGREGIFPRNCLEVLEEPSNGIPAAGKPYAIAAYDYDSSVPGDLNFRTGATIVLLEKFDGGWYRGSINGQEGIFPANFVYVEVDC